MLERVVVVGGSLAGLRAVESLRAGGYGGDLTVVGAETHRPYDRPPLSKKLLAGEWEPDRIELRKPDDLDTLGVTWRLGAPATGLDLDGAPADAGRRERGRVRRARHRHRVGAAPAARPGRLAPRRRAAHARRRARPACPPSPAARPASSSSAPGSSGSRWRPRRAASATPSSCSRAPRLR